MDPTDKCERCGAPLLEGSPSRGLQDLCPRCVMGFAMEEAPAAEAPPALKPGSTLGTYEIQGVLGRGGMGVVYKARHTGLDRVVALKVLSSGSSDPDFQERFRREAKALAALSHPNIVAVYDFGVVSGLPYLAMEFVDGVSLRKLLAEKRLPPEEAIAIVPQLCDALEYAHGAGVVHRDVKPENILITKSGQVKIADFGIAKIVRPEQRPETLTGTNVVIGTPAYMAPEQFDDPRRVDHRADIYSMGVVFYEMLTGEVPRGRFGPPSRKAPVDSRLDQIVLKSLEREPDDRYQRAREVKEDVTRLDEPAVPPVEPRLSRLALWGFGLSVFATLLLILFVLFVLLAEA